MYRIMVLAEETANNSSTYRFFKIKTSKGYKIYETDDKAELEQQVEDMLNGDYRKKDLLVISMIDFTIETDIDDVDATDDEPSGDKPSEDEPTNPDSNNTEPTTDPSTEPTTDPTTEPTSDPTGDSNNGG